MSDVIPEPRPAGVRLAALAFVVGAAFFAYAFVLRVAPSVMVDELMASFAVGGAVLGNLSAFYFYAYSGLQIPVGVMLDRIGPRRLMPVAAIVVGAGALIFAWADSVASAYLGRALIGAGCAFSWAGTLAIVNRFFSHRFALLAGVSQMIAMGGAMLGQGPLALVVERVGWRDATTMLAAAGVVIAVLLVIVVRDGERAPEVEKADARTVLDNPQTWLCAYLGLALVTPMLAFGALWGVPYLMSAYALPRTEAATVASLVFAGNALGSVMLGAWSDRIRNRRLPMLVGTSLATVATLAYLLLPGLSVTTVSVLVFLSGVGGGAMVIPFATALEHNPATHAGLTVGIINTAVTGSGALLQPLIGWLLDLAWDGTMFAGARVYTPADYQHALLVMPLLTVLAMLCLLAVRETHAQRIPKKGSGWK